MKQNLYLNSMLLGTFFCVVCEYRRSDYRDARGPCGYHQLPMG
jgi:hypothetical protein